MSYIELDTVPAYVAPVWANDSLQNRDDVKWSHANPPPAIGEKVAIQFNGLGSGTVVGYFVEENFLGLRVKLDKNPAWREKQLKGNPPALVFGAEVTY